MHGLNGSRNSIVISCSDVFVDLSLLKYILRVDDPISIICSSCSNPVSVVSSSSPIPLYSYCDKQALCFTRCGHKLSQRVLYLHMQYMKFIEIIFLILQVCWMISPNS